MVRLLENWWATTTRRRAKNKPLAHLPARVLNPEEHANQEAHDSLWLMPRVWTQDLSWWHQEVQRWANAFSSTANFMSFNSCEREISKKSRGGNSTNPVNWGRAYISSILFSPHQAFFKKHLTGGSNSNIFLLPQYTATAESETAFTPHPVSLKHTYLEGTIPFFYYNVVCDLRELNAMYAAAAPLICTSCNHRMLTDVYVANSPRAGANLSSITILFLTAES